MVLIMVTTKLYNRYQTVVPAEIRKKLGIKKDDILDWKVTDNGTAEIRIKRKISLKDMEGIFTAKEPINSVELKKKIHKGENI